MILFTIKNGNIMPKRNLPNHKLAPVEREIIDHTTRQQRADVIAALMNQQQVIVLPLQGSNTPTDLTTPPGLAGNNEDSSEENADWDPCE